MERPILFGGPMVRAILDGRKSHTRRVVKPQPDAGAGLVWARSISGEWGPFTMYHYREERTGWIPRDDLSSLRCPYGQPGDRLWVRETWGIAGDMPHDPGYVEYRADCHGNFNGVGDAVDRWRPSIHMRREDSRITLEITDVRVQRVQDISEEDARAEGVLWVPGHGEIERADLEEGYSNYLNCREGFQVLWDSINAKRGFGWNENPYVWALTFKRVEE